MSDRNNPLGGYPSTQPCDVCGAVNQCESEPRFGYVVCAEHGHLTPLQVSEAKKQREQTNNQQE